MSESLKGDSVLKIDGSNIERSLADAAALVLSPMSCNDIANLHLSFLLSVRECYERHGHEMLRIKFPGVSEKLAEALVRTSLQKIQGFCGGYACILTCINSDDQIIDALNSIADAHTKVTLQMLARV